MRRVVACALALLLSGCLAVERNVSNDVRIGGHWAGVALFDEKAQVVATAERALVRKADLNILALSGGGADGAFGAGFLAGWSASGTRPQFDIVTGVSTGALMSTFAFLGGAYDEPLKALYTAVRTEQIYSRQFGGLFGDGLNDTEPLKQTMAGAITPAVLDAVAAEHGRGRRLYVATTNLDAGTVMVWNMGAIAASGHPDRIAVYRDILRASAAVPGFFKPVHITPDNGAEGGQWQLHVDGAVKAPVLLRSYMLAGDYKRKSVYVLVNGAMRLRSTAGAVPATTIGIAKQSIAELLRGLTYKTIYQSYVTVRQAGASFNLAYIPDEVAETRDPLVFDPAEMTALFQAGFEAGRSGRAWQREPPRLEKLERIDGVRPAAAPRGPVRRPAAQASLPPA